MSGGFFRGTSADQDTRFSNKQAKLMKSQKFPSELDHLVDITKVKMDVMKPWIAQRATELLGFEDEVLINFIYGLLDGKAVNGKEIQISLTGFMEKNTGKFMKELWQLLLSAQNNVSGVPQQLLDAKEEETKKKQAESDKIKGELEKKKENEAKEFEEERIKKLDMGTGTAALEPSSKHHPDREIFARNGSRRRNRASRSPQSPGGLSLSPRNRRSSSMSKSFSNSRSYSEERRKSRGLSRSPISRGRARRSVTPHRKHSPPPSLSPPIRRSSHSRRRSTSRSRSPIRRRYMSRSPVGRRSQTPVRRRPRSPPRYRSRSPVRRRYPSPLRRRSPSPFRRGYRRSPSTPPRRSPSPVRRRSPIRNRRRSPTPPRHRSRSQESLGSPLPARRFSNSPVKKRSPKRQRSPLRSSRERTRAFKKSSPILHARPRGSSEDSDESSENPDSAVQRPSVSLRSPQRDTRAVSSSPSPQKSENQLKVPADSRRRSPSEDRRSRSPYKSHSTQSKEHKVRDVRARDQKPRHDSPVLISKKGESDRVRNNGNQKLKPSERPATSSRPDTQQGIVKVDKKHDYSPERSVGHHSKETWNRVDEVELNKRESTSAKGLRPDDLDKENVPAFHKETEKSTVKVDEKVGSGSLSSGSDDSLKRHKRKGHEYGKHRRSQKDEVTSDESSDSDIENRKVAKRRKKEEKRERKEERRRRREERHRKREERRAEKLKAKSTNETVPDQKKLEIELREKALESLRAKKGVRL